MTLAPATETISASDERAVLHRSSKTRAVAFVVPPGLARHAQLVGEFTSWTPLAMDRGADGAHRVTVSLEVGRSWMYQFILDDERVVNDLDAAFFVPGPDGGHVSALRV